MILNLYYVNDRDGDVGWMPIVAPTRARAKYLYTSQFDDSEWWEWPVTILLLAKDVDLPEGEYDDVTNEIYFEWVDDGRALSMWRDDLESLRYFRRDLPESVFYGS